MKFQLKASAGRRGNCFSLVHESQVFRDIARNLPCLEDNKSALGKAWKVSENFSCPWNEFLFAPASSVTEKNKNWDRMSLEGGKWKIGQRQWKIFLG